MATQDSVQAEPKPKANKAESVGKMALKHSDTAKGAADYVNGGRWGFRAFAKDNNRELGPGGWSGQARDDKWLILEVDRDTTPKFGR